MIISVRNQKTFIAGALAATEPLGCFAFSLVLIERLVAITAEVFPDALPPGDVQYQAVEDALDELWNRISEDATLPALSERASSWRPLTRDGATVRSVPGATLGFYVSDFLARSAAVPLNTRNDAYDLALAAWEAMTSILLRMPRDQDPLRPVTFVPLEAATNGALMVEYSNEAQEISFVARFDRSHAAALRQRARPTGRAIAAFADWLHPS